MSFASDISLGSANRTLTLGNNGVFTLDGAISNTGTGGITFSAASSSLTGRFEISGVKNTFSGPVTITGGEVRILKDGSLGNATNNITINGGKFGIIENKAGTIDSTRTIFLGTHSGTALITPGTRSVLTVDGTITSMPGTSANLVKHGEGILQISGAASYSGDTVIKEGTIRLSTADNRLPVGTVLRLGQAGGSAVGTLDLNGLNQEIAGLNSVIGNASTGDNTVTTASAATLRINVTGNNSFGDGTGNNSGVIEGPVSLLLMGSGRQTLGDTNTYSGTTTVQSGTLEINGDQSGATGVVTVGSGGALAGSGTIGGDTTIQTGGSLSGGLYGTVGTLSFSGNLTTEAGSHWLIDLVQNVNGSSDLIDVGNGALNISGSFLNLTTSGAYNAGNVYQIASFNPSGGITGTFNGLSEGAIFSNYQINYGTIVPGAITLTAVPEPGTSAVLDVLGFGAARVRRKWAERNAQKKTTFCEPDLSSSAPPEQESQG
jgi:fibronectin-binding autotransporter adhesin